VLIQKPYRGADLVAAIARGLGTRRRVGGDR
jgi:hypothetical protein